MTREETITVFKAFMDNPLFSDVHKAAFNIAIHDIKQRHDWDINKLMLVPKTEWEQEPILDKIRAEIKALSPEPTAYDVVDGNPIKDAVWETLADVLQIIDKYKAERTDNAEV